MSLLQLVAFFQLPAMLLISLFWVLSVEAAQQQCPLFDLPSRHQYQHQHHEHIAIIGAGIGGASAAFSLHELNRNLPSARKVTIFESKGEVGGRIKSSYLYPGRGGQKRIEEGATHFYAGDWCLASAMDDVGLKRVLPHPWPASWSTAHWRDDDVRTEIMCDAESTARKHSLHGIWKYGSSWRIFHSAVLTTLDAWNSFASMHPITSIRRALNGIGLSQNVYGPATTYLQGLSVNPALRDEFIQPCTGGRVSQHLSVSSGLSALLAAGQSTKFSINGGNSQLPERMIRLSEADLQTNTLVTAISPSYTKRYTLSISLLTSNRSSRPESREFDTVILAAPLQSADLDLTRLSLHPTVLLSPPGIETHVTHFSSPVAITTNLSSLPLDISLQGEMTLTTSNTTGTSSVLSLHRTSACFKRTECLPDDDCDQCDADTFLYRVHSDGYLADEELVQMVGQEWKEDAELEDYGIHYVRRQAWPYSYPKGGMDFVDEVEIAPNFWYLNGAESVMSSMEMSCRVGKNVAQQVQSRR